MKWFSQAFEIAKSILSKNKTKSMLITPEQLKTVATSMSTATSIEMAELFNDLAVKYGVTSKDVFHEFCANVLQESLEMQHKAENMNYRAETLMKVWPKRFPTMAIAAQFAHNPMKLANSVYGYRMGNNQPNDGYNFRGGGYIGLTGREVYTKYAKYAGYKTVEGCAEDVRNSNRAALDSAYWFFCVLKDLEDEAEKDDFIGIVKSINGGTIGLKDRLFYYERLKPFM